MYKSTNVSSEDILYSIFIFYLTHTLHYLWDYKEVSRSQDFEVLMAVASVE